jgi:hypothetical protein
MSTTAFLVLASQTSKSDHLNKSNSFLFANPSPTDSLNSASKLKPWSCVKKTVRRDVAPVSDYKAVIYPFLSVSCLFHHPKFKNLYWSLHTSEYLRS